MGCIAIIHIHGQPTELLGDASTNVSIASHAVTMRSTVGMPYTSEAGVPAA